MERDFNFKKLCSTIIAFLLFLSGCNAENSRSRFQGSTDDIEDPHNDNFLDVAFSERQQLLDFIVTADAQYPNNDTKQDGIFSDIFALAKEAGYISVLLDNGTMLESDSWIITACRDRDNRGFEFFYKVLDHSFFLFTNYLRTDQRDPFIEADISTCLKTYFPDYPRPDNWKEHDRITDCYFVDWAFEGTSIQCIVEQGIVGKDEDQHEYYKLYACYDHMLLTLWGWGTYDTALLSRLTLEKVSLPSEKEAQDRIDARENA